MMKVLVIGQGGREHAIVRQLSNSTASAESRTQLFVWPGSAAMETMATRLSTKVQSLATADERNAAVLQLVKENSIDLVVIGPEDPLADGLSDQLRASKVRVFGPSKAGARLESSKIHAKELMQAAGVKTARSFVVDSVATTMAVAPNFKPPYVLKADGLAAGKGVFIDKTLADLEVSARALFEARILGAAGQTALLEEFSPGYEVSHLVFTNGREFVSMPPARDHKRLREGDEGPNTGGMGVVAPVEMAPGLHAKIEADVVAPVIAEIARRKIDFRGVLYFGLMITDAGPSVLEFNTRFGDPEAQALLPLLDEATGDSLLEIFAKLADGTMPKIKWAKGRSVACVVLAAEGYPEAPRRGITIQGLPESAPTGPGGEGESGYLLHAGTNRVESGEFVTAGGRVLNAIGVSHQGLDRALAIAYGAAEKVNWPGRQIRRDIGRTV